jgi:ABC-type multidrug transport system fused ATPase/permease subunit
MQKINPRWFEGNDSVIAEFISKIEEIKASLDEVIKHTGLKRLRNVTRQLAPVFHIISDITGNDPSRLIALAADKELLAQEVKRAYEKRFNILKRKLRRASFGSVVSIFLSKILIALSFEIPFELLILNQTIPYSFFLSILFLPFLMFLIVVSIRLPSKKNLETLIVKVTSIINGTFTFEPINLRTKKRRLFTSLLLGSVQLLVLGIVFSAVIFILTLAHLSFSSIGVFLIFLSLIIFSGMRIKQWSYELTVETRNEGIAGFLVDVLSIPIVILGKTLAGKFYRFNIFILLTNLVFEAPFQSFINFVEEWRKFVGEKKEEL